MRPKSANIQRNTKKNEYGFRIDFIDNGRSGYQPGDLLMHQGVTSALDGPPPSRLFFCH